MGKNGGQKQDMLMVDKGVNWNDIETSNKRGTAAFKIIYPVGRIVRNKWVVDSDMPIISQDRNYSERWVEEAPILEDLSGRNSLLGLSEFL